MNFKQLPQFQFDKYYCLALAVVRDERSFVRGCIQKSLDISRASESEVSASGLSRVI